MGEEVANGDAAHQEMEKKYFSYKMFLNEQCTVLYGRVPHNEFAQSCLDVLCE